MTKLILKAVSSPKSAASAAVDQVVGQVDTASGAQRLSISAQANTQYRLVDSKTGQVIKNQTVVRKGKTLQIEVDGKNVAELDNFFPDEANDAAPQAQGSTYLVDTSATAEPSYGVVSAQSPAGDMVGESSVIWTPGMPALPLSEPVALVRRCCRRCQASARQAAWLWPRVWRWWQAAIWTARMQPAALNRLAPKSTAVLLQVRWWGRAWSQASKYKHSMTKVTAWEQRM